MSYKLLGPQLGSIVALLARRNTRSSGTIAGSIVCVTLAELSKNVPIQSLEASGEDDLYAPLCQGIDLTRPPTPLGITGRAEDGRRRRPPAGPALKP
jgi:hypothetical protein